MSEALDKILEQITLDMLPCAYWDCKISVMHDPSIGHDWRPVTDLYELGWYDGDEEDEWDL